MRVLLSPPNILPSTRSNVHHLTWPTARSSIKTGTSPAPRCRSALPLARQPADPTVPHLQSVDRDEWRGTADCPRPREQPPSWFQLYLTRSFKNHQPTLALTGNLYMKYMKEAFVSSCEKTSSTLSLNVTFRKQIWKQEQKLWLLCLNRNKKKLSPLKLVIQDDPWNTNVQTSICFQAKTPLRSSYRPSRGTVPLLWSKVTISKQEKPHNPTTNKPRLKRQPPTFQNRNGVMNLAGSSFTQAKYWCTYYIITV